MAPSPEHESTTISFRVDRATRRVISAVAYADLVAKTGTTARPGDVNVSDFVRDVLDEVIEQYASESGGVRALLEEYQEAELREVQAQLQDESVLDSLESRVASVASARASARQAKRQATKSKS